MSYDAELLAEGLCPDLVMVDTEDGPMDGRCMRPVVEVEVPRHFSAVRGEWCEAEKVTFACEAHSQARISWMTLSEPERLEVERREDAEVW
jgi:hypothetical protein